MPLIAPSVLSADFGRLADEVRAVTDAGADWIHVDVMDGHFVASITIGPLVVRAIRRATHLPLDVHLMVTEPQHLVPDFVDAGADRVTVHVEACRDVAGALDAIRTRGVPAGIALNPGTPLEAVAPYVDRVGLLLVMSVTPGKGGQAIVPGSMEKLGAARSLRQRTGGDFVIEVDGGIYPSNSGAAATAGADVLVAGSAVFGRAPDYATAIRDLRLGQAGGDGPPALV